MPAHLQEVELSQAARNLIQELETWLEQNGEYTVAAGMKHFEECLSKGREGLVIPLSEEIGKLHTNKPTLCGIARSKNNDGSWMINSTRNQCLVSVRVTTEDPYISADGEQSIPFASGKAVFCAASHRVKISSGIEFLCVHWAA